MKYLTPQQAADLLPFGDAEWIRVQLNRGDLEGSKVGGRWVTTKAAVDAMVAAGSNSTKRSRERHRRRRIA